MLPPLRPAASPVVLALAASLAAAAPAAAKTLVFCSEGSPENFYPGVNTTGYLPSLPSLLAPGSGSAIAAGPISVSLAFLDPAALLVTSAASAFAGAVVINGMVIQPTVVAHAFVHDGHDGEVVALDPSLGAEEGLFAVLIWFFHSVSLGDVNRDENAMQVDDPDHPMADDTAQDIVDSTDDNMIVDVEV